jgi:RimJ/RimL family protein N-acetyltransferase
MEQRAGRTEPYEINACPAGGLSKAELAACIAIVRSGEAVAESAMQSGLPRARVLVLARKGTRIVGVGVIKPVRRVYTSRIATRSGEHLDADTPELGYVAVDAEHRGHRLSHRIVAALLARHEGPLFATTSNDRMKQTLAKCGFTRKGREWKGLSGQLSLWMKE